MRAILKIRPNIKKLQKNKHKVDKKQKEKRKTLKTVRHSLPQDRRLGLMVALALFENSVGISVVNIPR